MLTVWCVWWRDPANPDKYTEYHVLRLATTVAKNLTIPHRFVCITKERLNNVETMPPPVDWPGWWGKLGLFRYGIAAPLNLYLDLDVVVTGDLTPIVESIDQHSMAMPLNWAQSGHGGCQSSVMVWRSCLLTNQIYTQFDPADIHWPPKQPWKYYGDQEWITHLRDTGVIRVRPIPEQYVKSYKYHCKQGLPADCRVAVFHGEPKPESVKASWFQW